MARRPEQRLPARGNSLPVSRASLAQTYGLWSFFPKAFIIFGGRLQELALAEGYSWLKVDELTITRDAIRVTPSYPVFGFDDDGPDPFMAQMQVQHTISALLTFRLLPRAIDEHTLAAKYLADIKTSGD